MVWPLDPEMCSAQGLGSVDILSVYVTTCTVFTVFTISFCMLQLYANKVEKNIFLPGVRTHVVGLLIAGVANGLAIVLYIVWLARPSQ